MRRSFTRDNMALFHGDRNCVPLITRRPPARRSLAATATRTGPGGLACRIRKQREKNHGPLARGALALLLSSALPALADSQPAPAVQTDCKQATKAEPATQPAPASADGTAPGNAGSTGWSGGTGGSHIGTSQNGGTPD